VYALYWPLASAEAFAPLSGVPPMPQEAAAPAVDVMLG
jgi:hypothetical protein